MLEMYKVNWNVTDQILSELFLLIKFNFTSHRKLRITLDIIYIVFAKRIYEFTYDYTYNERYV